MVESDGPDERLNEIESLLHMNTFLSGVLTETK